MENIGEHTLVLVVASMMILLKDFEDGDYSNLDWCNYSYKGEWEDVS